MPSEPNIAPVRRGVRRFWHLFGLSAFAIAQPLFAKLGPAPGFFAAHSLSPAEVVLLAIALVVLPPAALALVELVARLAGRRVRWIVHLLLVAGLVAVTLLPPLGGLSTALAVALALVLGAAFALAYARFRPVRYFASLLAFAPALFVVAFLFFSSTADLVAGNAKAAWRAEKSFRPPVVMIQFDGLPALLLQTKDRQVDAKRFPNFAKLARDGVWYRNASHVHENTVFSVPSFVDGQIPKKGITPTVQDHSPNLFTLLGPGYRMNVAEEATSLCPYEYCRNAKTANGQFFNDLYTVYNQIIRPENARKTLPSISRSWRAFRSGPVQTQFSTRKKTPRYVIRHLRSGRVARFRRWLGNIRGGDFRPELDYIHTFLPHEPREFLPDGTRYPSPDDALSGPPSYDDRFLSEQMMQRTVLQLGYTDKVVGTVMDRLKRLGIYDDALFIVVADHGESFLPPKATPAGPFVPGRLGYRRAVTRRNIADIASIPMFIKYPKGRGPSGTDDRFVRSVDVFPTIAKVLGLDIPPVAGRVLTDKDYRGVDAVRVQSTFGGPVRVSASRWQRERQRSLSERLRLVGQGDYKRVYALGPRPDLIGDGISDHPPPAAATAGAKATIDGASRFANVNPGAPVCLCLLAGRLEGLDPAKTSVAIALNDRIVATARGFASRGKKRLNWSALIPADAYRPGRNRVGVYRIVGNELEPLTVTP